MKTILTLLMTVACFTNVNAMKIKEGNEDQKVKKIYQVVVVGENNYLLNTETKEMKLIKEDRDTNDENEKERNLIKKTVKRDSYFDLLSTKNEEINKKTIEKEEIIKKIMINKRRLTQDEAENAEFNVLSSSIEDMVKILGIDGDLSAFDVKTFCENNQGLSLSNFAYDRRVWIIMMLTGMQKSHRNGASDLYAQLEGIITKEDARNLGYSMSVLKPTVVQKTKKKLKKLF